MRNCSLFLFSLSLVYPAVSRAEEAKKDNATNIGVSALVDVFGKNFNDSHHNLKSPRLYALDLHINRDLGESSSAGAEVRVSEVENKHRALALRQYHLTWRTPVEGLKVSFARQWESGLYGYADGKRNELFATTSAFNGKMNIIEGFNTEWAGAGVNVSYFLARDAEFKTSFKENNESDKAGRNWYHKVTASTDVAGANLELGLGQQGHFITVDGEDKHAQDMFIHLAAEYPVMPTTKVKAGVAYDSYATTKEDKIGANTVMTFVLSGRHEVSKELAAIAEFDMRNVAMAEEVLTNHDKAEATKTMSQQALVLGAQWFADSKLSFAANYAMFMTDTGSKNVGYGEGMNERLVKGSDRAEAAKSESAISLRMRYDF